MRKFSRSMGYALHGLQTTWKEERNFRIEVALVFLSLFVMVVLGFRVAQLIPVIISSFILIAAEIMNTVVEDLCDKVEPKHDLVIKKVKDMAAAFVLVIGLGTGVVVFLSFLFHFS